MTIDAAHLAAGETPGERRDCILMGATQTLVAGGLTAADVCPGIRKAAVDSEVLQERLT
jgi:hypothetical protein